MNETCCYWGMDLVISFKLWIYLVLFQLLKVKRELNLFSSGSGLVKSSSTPKLIEFYRTLSKM